MPRNNATTSGSHPHPSDEEPPNHRGRSRRMPGDCADQDDVAGMPRTTTTHRRRSHSDTPTDSLSDTDSENPEARPPRGRSAEGITRDGDRLRSPPSTSPPAYRPRHCHHHPDGLAVDPVVVVSSGRAQNRDGPQREFPWGAEFACLRRKAQTVIDHYLHREHGRDRGHVDHQLPQDLAVLLCVYFLCHDRGGGDGDGTGAHVRRCRPLALLCLDQLGEASKAAGFGHLVHALATYCGLQNCHMDKDLQERMGRVLLERGVLAALNDRQDYQDLLGSGKVHPQQMALLLNHMAVCMLSR
ncbi:hypothetical protein MMC29_004182 [Sticta canariensis]|nr:hypothetical protein [Sticta canariensis]